jgi:hypothetical protein
MRLPNFDPYRELEVDPNASVETIEAAYKALMRRHHPDKGNDDTGERAKRLNIARGWLVDPQMRARYDATLSRMPSLAPPRATKPRDTGMLVATLTVVGAGGLLVAIWAVSQPHANAGSAVAAVLGLAIALIGALGLGALVAQDVRSRR